MGDIGQKGIKRDECKRSIFLVQFGFEKSPIQFNCPVILLGLGSKFRLREGMGPVLLLQGTLVHPGTGFARNTLPNRNACLVCCFLQLHAIYQLNFGFCKTYLLG